MIRNPETGEVKDDIHQSKMWLEYVKMMETLYKSDPSTKLYYSGGALLDPKAASEGIIHKSNMPLFNQWEKDADDTMI